MKKIGTLLVFVAVAAFMACENRNQNQNDVTQVQNCPKGSCYKVTFDQIIQWLDLGKTEGWILKQIDKTESSFCLTPEQKQRLFFKNVSKKFMNKIDATCLKN